MATITSLNQYKASFPDSTDMSVAAGTMQDALVALGEAKNIEPSMLQKIATGIAVAIPAPAIAIETFVTGTGAAAAGCKATPYSISSVENGDKVWFTAIAVEGFVFDGWYLGDEKVSELESYEATIAYPGSTPTTLKYEARFVVA
jgi:hypothetical protein